MAKVRVLERLLRLRQLEEDRSRLALESAVGERARIAAEMASAASRAAGSREQFAAGLGDPDSAQRRGAAIEWEQARRLQQRILPRLEQADLDVSRQREEFLFRRTGRRQVETMLDRERETEREEAGRRAQQMLDDWYGRLPRRGRALSSEAVESGLSRQEDGAPPDAPGSR